MRLKIDTKKQVKFLVKFKNHKKFENWKALSKFLGINYKTFMHYVEGRYFLPEEVMRKAEQSGMDISVFRFERLDDNWGSKIGGKLGGKIGMQRLKEKYGARWKNFPSKGGKNRTKNLPRKLRLEISRRGGIKARDMKVGIHDPRFGQNRFLGPFDLKYRSNIEVKVARLLEAKGIAFEYEKAFTIGSKRILLDFYLPKQKIAIEIEGFGYDGYLKRNLERYKLLNGKIPIYVFTKHITKTKKFFESLDTVSILNIREFENFANSFSPMRRAETADAARHSVGRRAGWAEAWP